MKYIITLYNKWKRPYFYVDKSDAKCINTECSIYETDDVELCKTIIKDFLDVPASEMTLDEVRKQFTSLSFPDVPEFKLVCIQNYYNGRLSMYNTIIRDFNDSVEHENTLTYDIPYEYNYFSIDVEDEYGKSAVQLKAYIEIKIEKN